MFGRLAAFAGVRRVPAFDALRRGEPARSDSACVYTSRLSLDREGVRNRADIALILRVKQYTGPPDQCSDSMGAESRSCPRRILIVDDFPNGRELLAEYLRLRGFDVI
jgi:hypothetical protein